MPNRSASFFATSSIALRAFFGGNEWAWRMSMWDMLGLREGWGHCAGTWRCVQAATGCPMGAVSKQGRMLDFRAVDSFRLRFSNQPHADLVIGAGVHGIGHV